MKMKKTLATIAFTVFSLMSLAQAPAFPGAEGHARYITGGRGGEIRHQAGCTCQGGMASQHMETGLISGRSPAQGQRRR